MADIAQVGGKNASLGEMVSNLSGAGVRVPGGFATTADAYREFLAADGLYDRIRRPSRRSTSPTWRSWPGSARMCGSGSWRSRFPRSSRTRSVRRTRRWSRRSAARVRVVGGALQRDCRGPSGCLVRRSAGDVPEHQRHREHPRRRPERVRVALQRPCDRVPRAPWLRPPRRRAVGGRTADGAIGCRCLRRAVHRRHRVGVRPRRVHHELVRARRGGRPGRRQPGRVLRLQARAAGRSSGDPEAVGGGEGREDGLRPRQPRRRQHRLHRRPAGGSRAVQHHGCRGGGAGPAGADHRGALRPADGHRVGQGRRRRRAVHPAGPPRDRRLTRRRQRDAPVRARGAGVVADRGTRDRAEDRRGSGAGDEVHRPDGPVPGGRRAGGRHDRPGLGADHEARLGDRHQPRRPHLSRRDHRPRAGHPRGRRHRRRHPRAPRRAGGDGVVRRRRHRLRLPGHPQVRRGRDPAGRDAREPGEDHAQRRHARSGVLVLQAPQPGRRAGAPRVRHQPADRHPPPRAARVRHARRRCATRSPSGSAPTRRRASTS